MTLDQIETFLMVVECGSFKSAAETLHRSQPALSVAVKKLEEGLGVKLFDRDHYRPVLTSAGEAFYNKSKDLFESAQSLEKFGRQLGLGEEPELSIAIDVLCPIAPVLQTFRCFSSQHPDTRLNISFEILGGAADKVASGEVHMAISPEIGMDTGKFDIHSFSEVTMIPVASSLLIGDCTESCLSSEFLKQRPQIIVSDSNTRSSGRTFGVLRGGRQWRVREMGVKRDIIQAGLGWGSLPDHLIDADLANGSLVEVETPDIRRESFEIVILRSHHHPMGPLGQKLWEIFSN